MRSHFSGNVRNGSIAVTSGKGWKADIPGHSCIAIQLKLTLVVALLALPLIGCGEAKYTEDGMCGGRPEGWLSPSSGIGELAVLQPIHVTSDDAVIWNGKTITTDKLSNFLALQRELNPRPQTSLIVDAGAGCKIVVEVRRRMEEALNCKSWGGCGEGHGWRRYPGARIED